MSLFYMKCHNNQAKGLAPSWHETVDGGGHWEMM